MDKDTRVLVTQILEMYKRHYQSAKNDGYSADNARRACVDVHNEVARYLDLQTFFPLEIPAKEPREDDY